MTRPLLTDAPADRLRALVRFCRASGYTGDALQGYVRQLALAQRLRVPLDRLAALVADYTTAQPCEACSGRGFVIPAPRSPTLPYGPDEACPRCEGEGWVGLPPTGAA